MGNLNDAMQSMVDDLRSAAEARRAAFRQLMEDIGVRLSEIRSDTHNLIERFGREDSERKGAVSELKASANGMVEGFRRESSERKGAVGQMLGEFRKADNQRKADVSELKGNAKNMIGDFHKANSELKATVGEMLGVFGSDRRQAHQIWTQRLKEKIKPRAVVRKVKAKPKVEAAPTTEEKILEVIAGHPEGIRLVDIGNELGVDWRILIGPSKSLVDGGQVEKIENMYYPKT
jgi:hypothetical protein